MEQALGIDGNAGLHPDDLAAVRSVRERIDRNPVSVPDIATLAREYAVSASKLSRDFKRAYGVSIHACIIGARLEEAARLLSSGQMSVAEVAERVGYAKHSQFSEAFRRRFGVLPKDY
jgi:AraC-like DNA-binding protein